MIKIKKRKFLLLPGDGIGPEVVGEVKKIMKKNIKRKSYEIWRKRIAQRSAQKTQLKGRAHG